MVIVVAAVLAFLVWDGLKRSRHLLKLSESYGVSVDAPGVDARSPTGYADGRRSMLLPVGAADTQHWIMHTQTMIHAGTGRVRAVAYDNAPHGREVHWASPIRWWLGAVAAIDRLLSGRHGGQAVERAALVAGPALLVLVFMALIPWLTRQFAVTAAALTAVGAVAFYPFYIDFMPGRLDHHGLANLCGGVSVLLFAGSSISPTGAARRWLVASGLVGGMGLWISASAQVLVLIGLGLGVIVAGWVGRKDAAWISWIKDPGLLRAWGLVGGAASLVAYAMEYFPTNLGLRLEINHPLYAVAWIGAGEVLRVAVTALRDGSRALSRRDQAQGGIALSLVALPPAVVALTGATTFTIADPFLWQLHNLHIAEFTGLARLFSTQGLNWSSLGHCVPALMLILPLGLLVRRTTPTAVRVPIALVLVPAVLGWILGWTQVRWLGLAFALSVPVLAVSFRALRVPGVASRRMIVLWTVAGGVLLLPGVVSAVQRTGSAGETTTEEIRQLLIRDVAHVLRLRGGAEPVVVAAAPNATTRLVYWGGLKGLGTLYWENVDGLKAAAALFAATSATEARTIAQRLGVTHLVVFSWDPFEVVQAKLSRGLAAAAPIPADLFIANLLTAPVPPPWLRAIPFSVPDHPTLQGQAVRIWEVTPEQTPAETLAHAASHFLELGQPEFAARLAPALARYPDDLTAAVMLAGIASRRSDTAGLARALERVLALRTQAAGLSLDDHVHLVVVLAVGQQVGLARDELRRAVAKADERSLRHLTPGTLADLLALSEALGIEIPDTRLRQLAERLLPPDGRR